MKSVLAKFNEDIDLDKSCKKNCVVICKKNCIDKHFIWVTQNE